MFSSSQQTLMGLVVLLSASSGILSPVLAHPSPTDMSGLLLSQAPDTWNVHGDVPIVDNTSISGQITNISGDDVQLTLADGGTHTFKIPAFDQRLYNLKVGSGVTLTVRKADEHVVAISDVTSSTGNNR